MMRVRSTLLSVMTGGILALSGPAQAQASSLASDQMSMPQPTPPATTAPDGNMPGKDDMPAKMKPMMMMDDCKAMAAEMRALRAEIAELRAALAHRHSSKRARRAATSHPPQDRRQPAPAPAPEHQHVH